MRKQLHFILLLATVFVLTLCVPASAKSLFYADNPSQSAQATGLTLNTGTQMITGQCNLQSITVTNAVAGGYVLFYDNTSATGTPKYDIAVGTANSSVTLRLNHTEIATGIFADANNSTSFVTIEYTQ